MPDREHELTARELKIAEKAADLAIEKFYATVGKWTLQRLLIMVGGGAIAAYIFFKTGRL